MQLPKLGLAPDPDVQQVLFHSIISCWTEGACKVRAILISWGQLHFKFTVLSSHLSTCWVNQSFQFHLNLSLESNKNMIWELSAEATEGAESLTF